MKKLILSAAALAAFTLAATSCGDAPKADEAKVGEAQTVTPAATEGTTYKADLAATKVEWIGSKPTGQHHGTIGVKEGSLMAKDNAITGGKFTMDMTSIKADDGDAESNGKLTGHLSGADFFDSGKYPNATFEITGVKAGVDSSAGKVLMQGATHTITGNLMMKDMTKSITFPAKVAMTDANITADADFNIDRTQWGIKYNSGKGMGDKMINDDINLKLHLVANK